MSDRYEIVVEKGGWYKEEGHIGPWELFPDTPTFYSDFKEALDLVFEWGRNQKGELRKNNKIGIYDHEDDKFYTQERCFRFEKIIYVD